MLFTHNGDAAWNDLLTDSRYVPGELGGWAGADKQLTPAAL
jgi:hypothetical protein